MDETRDEIIEEEDKVLQEEDLETITTQETGGGLDIIDVDEVVAEETTATEAIDPDVQEASSTEAAEGEQAVEYSSLARKVYDVPPPDLSQVGKRMDSEEHWYVLHTFNGYELVAEDNLKKVVEKYRLQDRIKEIFIPTEDIVVEKRGKKTLVPTRTMPSYLFIKMLYGDDLWHTITRTRGITGFVGPRGRPLPLTPKEVLELKLERRPNLNVKLAEGDLIQVIEGPLAGQSGNVLTVDAEAKKCTVSVMLFSKPTQVELAFSQIKKQ